MSLKSEDRPPPAICGWFDHDLALRSHKSAPRVSHDPATARTTVDGPAFSIQLQDDCGSLHVDDGTVTAVLGTPRDSEKRALSAAEVARLASESDVAESLDRVHGRFAIVHIDLKRSRAALVTDRFAVFPLCYANQASKIAFADRADQVPDQGSREIDPQAIFNYAYFHVIPAPRTVFQRTWRIEAATRLWFDSTGPHSRSTWTPLFVPKPNFNVPEESRRFRTLLRRSVEREITTSATGAFLSGGTDSSTVVGLLRLVTGEPVDCFSIGFDASGYDEMQFARLAARHFNCRHHEHYLTPDELVTAIPRIAAYYDQPFGNSSAVPAYYCSHVAHSEGIVKLLAGDGGDELFGGNSRYARQKVFDAYSAVPLLVRQHALEPLLLRSGNPRRVPGLRKLARYVEQARTSMPERMESYNLLDRFGVETVFSPALLRRVNINEPKDVQRAAYRDDVSDSMVDRMLAYDWRFTLTDNDLPKVRLTAQLAGEQVGFPLLDDELVDYSLSLPASMKVRGLALRYFFKTALREFLPTEVIRKKKHGFGLPFGPWLIQNERLAHFAVDALDRLAERGFVRRELVHDLFSFRLREHPGFYGEMVWILMMLEYWLDSHAPAFKLD